MCCERAEPNAIKQMMPPINQSKNQVPNETEIQLILIFIVKAPLYKHTTSAQKTHWMDKEEKRRESFNFLHINIT